MNEEIARWVRFYAQQSEVKYRSPSGADKVDAERDRLTAAALRSVLMGRPVEEAVEWFRKEWAAFAREQNRKVDAAPKMRHGPMSGCSSIHYKAATDANGEQGETNIRRSCACLQTAIQRVAG